LATRQLRILNSFFVLLDTIPKLFITMMDIMLNIYVQF